jgi:putative restriction endonuclease
MTVNSAIERLYELNPGTTPMEEGSPHERPHKPLLLLAALDLIDEGLATPERIPWCQQLRDRFSARFVRVRIQNNLFQ